MNDGMKPGLLTMIVCFLAVLAIGVGCLHRCQNSACKQRGAAYRARVEKLKRDAHEQLKAGTKKDAVIRVFKENGIPVKFSLRRGKWHDLHVRMRPAGLWI